MRVGGDEVHATDFFGFPDGGYTKVLERERWCKCYPLGSWDDEPSRNLVGLTYRHTGLRSCGCLGCWDCDGGALRSGCDWECLDAQVQYSSTAQPRLGVSAGFQCCKHQMA